MRALIVISVLLVGALVGGLALLPRLVTWDDYRAELTRQAEAITGQTVAIAGRIDLELLPRPTLTLAQATLSSPSDAAAGRSLEVGQLDLRLRPLPLLRGQLAVEEVRLVRPVLRVRAPGATPAALMAFLSGGMVLPLGAGGPSRLSVVDGRATVTGVGDTVEHELEAINLEVAAAGQNGPYTLDGELVVAAQPFAVSASLGRIEANAWSPLQLVVTAPAALPPNLSDGAQGAPGALPPNQSDGAQGAPAALPPNQSDGAQGAPAALPPNRSEGAQRAPGALPPNPPSGAQPAPAPGSDPTTLSFRGLAWSDLAAPRLRGGLALTGSDAQAGLGALGRALGRDLGTLPPWLAGPFRLAARLELLDHQAELGELRVALAGTEAEGSLRVGLGPKPTIDLQLELPHLAAPDAWPLDGAGARCAPSCRFGDHVAALAPLAALARLEGRIDLSIQALDWRGGTIRRLRTTLALSGAGGMTVEQARATLPGQTSVGFTGALDHQHEGEGNGGGDREGEGANGGDREGEGANGGAGVGENGARLHGVLKVVSDDLGGLLGWLGLAPTGVAAGRLRTLSLASQVALDRGALRFTDAELRVDASRLAGSLALGLDERPQLAGVVTLDRLNLDAYLPADQAARLVEGGLQVFASVDAALEARVERLTWRGLRLEGIVLDGRSVAGRLTLNELSLRDAADTDLRLTGEIDLARRAFDLSAALETARPAQLLRRLGMAPPLLLTRLAPVSVLGSARGDLDAFDLELELREGLTRLGLKGTVAWPGAQPTYALSVDASHPDYPRLLEALGLHARPATAEPLPFGMTGKLTGDPAGQTDLVGTARLGAMSLTGLVGWQRGPARPKLVLRISAGEPSAEGLASLAALAGLRPDPILIEGPRRGAWPTRPLGFGWLGLVDAELELSAKGGLAGPGFEVRARLDQGRLLIDHLSTALWQGQLVAQASLDGARPLPFLALALDLRAIDPRALAAWLHLPPVLEGQADLYLEATTAGANLRDLVGGLIGDARIALQNGRLLGADLPRLTTARPPTPAPDAAPAPGAIPPGGTGTGSAPGGPGAEGAPGGMGTEGVPGEMGAESVPGEMGAESVPGEMGTESVPGAMGAESAPGVAVPSLTGSFKLKRGIATAAAVQLTLADTPARLEGTIDLLLWAADLTLSLTGERGSPDGAPKLRLVGPLDRPQIRLLLPLPPIRPQQAP